MKRRWVTWIIIAACVLINIGEDHFTKQIAVKKLKGKPPVSYFKDFILLTYTENDGAFLSIFSGVNRTAKTIILIIFPVIALAGGTFYIFYTREMSLLEKILAATIIGGGISNTADRILYGEVVDFLNFGVGSLRTGILNVADISITFGAGILIIVFLKKSSKERNRG